MKRWYSFFSAISTLSLSLMGSHAIAEGGTEVSVVIQQRDPILFVPIDLKDLVNPETKAPYNAKDVVKIEVAGKLKWQGYASDLVILLNDAERHFAQLGETLRNRGNVNFIEMFAHGEILNRQYLESLRLRASLLKDKVKSSLKNCDLLNITQLSTNVKTGLPFQPDEEIPVPLNGAIGAQDFVERINQQQQFLCSIGYNLLEGIDFNPTGDSKIFDRIMSRRAALMSSLGISRYAPLFSMASIKKITSYAEIALEVKKSMESGKIPSPQQLWALQGKVNAQLPAQFQIPELPNIPSPVLPKRTDLTLIKKKEWNVHEGKDEIASYYANSWYEVRGNERQTNDAARPPGAELDVRGQGKAGIYLFAREQNFVNGEGVFSANTEGVNGHANASFLGKEIWKENFERRVSWTKSNPSAYAFQQSVDYTQEFMVGPVPVVVTASVVGKMSIGYEMAANITQVYGKLVPGMEATAHILGGIGVRGLSVGAGGSMVLLNASVPLRGDAGFAFRPADQLPYLKLGLRSDFSYHYLDGNLFAHIEYPWVDCGWMPPHCRYSTKKARKEIFAKEGRSGTRPIMNWGMEIHPFGAKVSGDLLDQTDNELLSSLNEAKTIETRELELAKSHQALAQKEHAIFAAIVADLNTAAKRQVQPLYFSERVHTAEKELAKYIARLEEFSETK